ncbi:MAG: DinB family protein [Candidatus Sumerlaeaceae bacterium]|nr:DinB family protein [Candidatus Sumerlaeaceae bacterium]
MSTKDKLRNKLATELLRTHRLARLFGDKELSLTPAAGSMSCAELLAHIVASRHFLRGVLSETEPRVELFKVPVRKDSAAALLGALADTYREVLAALDNMPEAWLETIIAPFGPDWQMSRFDMALLMLEHEIHHRGQLSVYARVAGMAPPDLYAPVSEEILEETPRG